MKGVGSALTVVNNKPAFPEVFIDGNDAAGQARLRVGNLVLHDMFTLNDTTVFNAVAGGAKQRDKIFYVVSSTGGSAGAHIQSTTDAGGVALIATSSTSNDNVIGAPSTQDPVNPAVNQSSGEWRRGGVARPPDHLSCSEATTDELS